MSVGAAGGGGKVHRLLNENHDNDHDHDNDG